MTQGRAGDISPSPLKPLKRNTRGEPRATVTKALTEIIPSEILDEVDVNPPTKAIEKLSTDLWYMHGQWYDLTPFIPSHPGGTAILKIAKGLPDATPLMESYHAFANKEYVYKTMAAYKVDYVPADALTCPKTETTYTFEPNGFYMTLTRRVREHFGATKNSDSLTKTIKANQWWTFKVASQATLLIGFYLLAFMVPDVSTLLSTLSAAAAGIMLIALGMNSMHDASHYAIGARDSWKNKVTMRVWDAAAFWDPSLWLYHHTVRHHAFTGDNKLDPDIVHAAPVVRKHLSTDRSTYTSFTKFLNRQKWWWAFFATLIYTLLPGMYVAQVISYRVKWPLQGEEWNMKIAPTKNVMPKYWWEHAISLAVLGAHIYKADILVSFVFFLAANITYALCIIPDHDTFDTAIENHVEGGKVDWGEIQVRHSSDFGGQGFLGGCFTEMFGCINVQIGHHLFPSLNHTYLPEIVPIIKQTCEEFDIPYAHQGSIPAAIWSFVKTVYRCMGPDGETKYVKSE
jgi:fatty acid desaturase